MGDALAEGYRLVQAGPTVEDYLELRQRSGLTPTMRRVTQADTDPGAGSAYVSLLADPPGRSLYARHGFTDTSPQSIGMALRML